MYTMRKIIYSTLMMAAATSVFTACSIENDFVFSESAAERLNNAEVKYSNLLTSSPNGWAFEYYPTDSEDNGALLYAVKFDKNGTVTVAGDPTTEHVIKSETSLWDIVLDQGPVLSFSTYNDLIHRWSNPNSDGEGDRGDYEFSFIYDEKENADSVVSLRGKKRGLKSRLKMIEDNVTPEEYLLDVDAVQQKNFPTTQKNYSLLFIGKDTIRLDNMKSTIASYYPVGSDPIFFAKPNSYLLAKYNGKYTMRFNKQFTDSDSTVTEKNFTFDAEKQEFIGEKGNARITPPISAKLASEGLLSGDVSTMKLAKASAMSDSFKALWTSAESALKKKNNTLNESAVSVEKAGEGNNCTVTIKYKPRTGAAVTLYYLFNISELDNKVTLSYVGPYNSAATTVLTNFAECEDYIKAFAGTYTVDNPGENKFTVSNLRFTSADDANKWFTLAVTCVANSATAAE